MLACGCVFFLSIFGGRGFGSVSELFPKGYLTLKDKDKDKEKEKDRMKILFASKHDLDKEMEGSLIGILKPESGETIEIDQRMIIWHTSEDEVLDNDINTEMWADLHDQYDVICGAFPPSAYIALTMARDEISEGGGDDEIRVFTPIAAIGRGCTGRIYKFLRWQEI